MLVLASTTGVSAADEDGRQDSPAPIVSVRATEDSTSASLEIAGAMTTGQGEILYIRNYDELRVMQSDGSSSSSISPVTYSYGAQWSPDGSRIAYFDVGPTNTFDLYVVNADGTGRRPVLERPNTNDVFPAWSPDGRRLVFSSNPHGYQQLHVIDVTGVNLRQLTRGGNDKIAPKFAPDGRKIAFGCAADDICVMNTDGSQWVNLLPGPQRGILPDWSPDGRRIAYSDGKDIWVIDADGTNRRRFTFSAWDDNAPSWDSTGTKIAFARIFYDGSYTNADLFYKHVDTGALVLLTRRLGDDDRPDWRPQSSLVR